MTNDQRSSGFKTWRVETFKISNDPHFEDNLIDVVGLYMNPPKRAVVFSFDEKTQTPHHIEVTARAEILFVAAIRRLEFSARGWDRSSPLVAENEPAYMRS